MASLERSPEPGACLSVVQYSLLFVRFLSFFLKLETLNTTPNPQICLTAFSVRQCAPGRYAGVTDSKCGVVRIRYASWKAQHQSACAHPVHKNTRPVLVPSTRYACICQRILCLPTAFASMCTTQSLYVHAYHARCTVYSHSQQGGREQAVSLTTPVAPSIHPSLQCMLLEFSAGCNSVVAAALLHAQGPSE